MTETTSTKSTITDYDVELYEWLVDHGYTNCAARLLRGDERVSVRKTGIERIVSHETRRRSYVGHSNGHNNGTSWVIGPVLVDVVEHDHFGTARGTLTPTYTVEIDGRHQCGGPLRFLDEDDDGTPLLAWTQLVSIDVDELTCRNCDEPVIELPRVGGGITYGHKFVGTYLHAPRI